MAAPQAYPGRFFNVGQPQGSAGLGQLRAVLGKNVSAITPPSPTPALPDHGGAAWGGWGWVTDNVDYWAYPID